MASPSLPAAGQPTAPRYATAMRATQRTDLPLPSDWPDSVKSALLHATALAHRAAVASRGWAANSSIASVRAKGDAAAVRAELELLQQEIAIRDARSARVPPRHRPHHTPEERLLILALRAAGWLDRLQDGEALPGHARDDRELDEARRARRRRAARDAHAGQQVSRFRRGRRRTCEGCRRVVRPATHREHPCARWVGDLCEQRASVARARRPGASTRSARTMCGPSI